MAGPKDLINNPIVEYTRRVLQLQHERNVSQRYHELFDQLSPPNQPIDDDEEKSLAPPDVSPSREQRVAAIVFQSCGVLNADFLSMGAEERLRYLEIVCNHDPHKITSTEVPATELELLCEELTKQPRQIVTFLDSRKHKTDFDSIKNLKNTFRAESDDVKDDTLLTALKRTSQALSLCYSRFRRILHIDRGRRKTWIEKHEDK